MASKPTLLKSVLVLRLNASDSRQDYRGFEDAESYEEESYGEIPPGKEVLYSKPEALKAVSDIASSTSCPYTQELLNNFVRDNRVDDYEDDYVSTPT